MNTKIFCLTFVLFSLQIIPIQGIPFDTSSIKRTFQEIGTTVNRTFGELLRNRRSNQFNASIGEICSSIRRPFDRNYSDRLTALVGVGVIATGTGLLLFLKRPKNKTAAVAQGLTQVTLLASGMILILAAPAAYDRTKDVIAAARDVIENAMK